MPNEVTKKLMITFNVPIEVKIKEGFDPAALLDHLRNVAIDRLNKNSKAYTPQIEEVYEVIPKDETGSNQVSGHQDGRSQVDNNLGTDRRQDTDHNQDLQGDESGSKQRDHSSATSEVGNGFQDREESQRGVHIDKTV